jgi:hypothetical protein
MSPFEKVVDAVRRLNHDEKSKLLLLLDAELKQSVASPYGDELEVDAFIELTARLAKEPPGSS